MHIKLKRLADKWWWAECKGHEAYADSEGDAVRLVIEAAWLDS